MIHVFTQLLWYILTTCLLLQHLQVSSPSLAETKDSRKYRRGPDSWHQQLKEQWQNITCMNLEQWQNITCMNLVLNIHWLIIWNFFYVCWSKDILLYIILSGVMHMVSHCEWTVYCEVQYVSLLSGMVQSKSSQTVATPWHLNYFDDFNECLKPTFICMKKQSNLKHENVCYNLVQKLLSSVGYLK